MLVSYPHIPRSNLALSVLSLIAVFGILAGGSLRADDPRATQHEEYTGIVAHRGAPESETDWSFAPFSDQGAWFGFALPPSDRQDLRGGFSGPFLISNGRWLSGQLLTLHLHDGDTGKQIRLSEANDHAFTSFPGLLRETMTVDGLSIRQSLWFDRIDANHSGMALLKVTVENTTRQQKKISIGWAGTVFKDEHRLETNGYQLSLLGNSGYKMRVHFGSETGDLKLDGHSFQTGVAQPHLIVAGGSLTTTVAIDLSLDGDLQIPLAEIDARLTNISQSYELNRGRWNRWLAAVDPGKEAGEAVRGIAIKSLQTMINNWRGPAGRLAHHGMFPSHNVWYFNGYWAWDTWKQAVGVLSFDTELAKALVRGMFRHQGKNGMIPDVVYLDSKEDNWRDSKPPLAGWAIDAIYQQSGDLDFVRELYPKLVAYHEFWYRDRDHNNNGLCEYGSTDGTLEAARWESGMDNAVRFDESKMLHNGVSAWSMNQESVDLNSYLFVEKQALARLAQALGKDDQNWLEQADQLKTSVRGTFFDEVDGWFYDVNIEDGSFIRTQSPEGWIPLWAEVASQQQAERLRHIMMAPEKFRTYIPFPTVAADNPAFSNGYWRGLVWLDQAYFAIKGLRNYGFESDANELSRQLFSNLKGVTEPGVPIYENYHPLTGEGHNVSHFSWSAAHLLMLVRDIR